MCHTLVILGCGLEGHVAFAGFEVGVADGMAVGVVDGGVVAVADSGQGGAVVGASDADAVRAVADGAGVEDGAGVDGGVGLDGQVAGAAEGGGLQPGLVWGGPAAFGCGRNGKTCSSSSKLWRPGLRDSSDAAVGWAARRQRGVIDRAGRSRSLCGGVVGGSCFRPAGVAMPRGGDLVTDTSPGPVSASGHGAAPARKGSPVGELAVGRTALIGVGWVSCRVEGR
jgi:hypothetical protein